MELKRTVAGLLDAHPRLFLPLVRRFATGKVLVAGPYTELVISGYPRSANSFASMAIFEAQPRPIEIASHLHAPAEVIDAVRRGLPTVVLIRRPEDAIRSLKAAKPALDENRELKRWIRYYARVEPLHAGFVISPFERTIDDIGGVIDEVNERFGTSFQRFDNTEENRARISERLRQTQARFGTQHWAGAPDDRGTRLRDVSLEFDQELLARALALHARFGQLSGWRRRHPAPSVKQSPIPSPAIGLYRDRND